MPRVHSFISEVASDLVNLIKPTDNEPLQVKFWGNAQIQVHVKGIVVSYEGTSQSTAINGLKDGGFNFYETSFVQKSPYGLDYPRALDKDFADFRVGDQVKVTLPIANFNIPKPVPLLWNWAQGFRQDPKLGDLNGDFTRPCFGDNPLNADDVAGVQLPKLPVCFLPDIIEPDQKLNSPGTVHQVGESEFTMLPEGCQPTRNPNRLTLQSFVARNNLCC
jgi:hypothetical protein